MGSSFLLGWEGGCYARLWLHLAVCGFVDRDDLGEIFAHSHAVADIQGDDCGIEVYDGGDDLPERGTRMNHNGEWLNATRYPESACVCWRFDKVVHSDVVVKGHSLREA